VYITLVLLGAGTIFYAWAEKLRFEGKKVFIVSTITNLSLRERDRGKYVLGPVTLGLGAMAALFFYPEPAASIAIYALAFGDSFSSIIGKAFGGIKIPLTGGKTVSGSITCFITVFAVSAFITANPTASLVIAFAATFFEALPIRDMDNIIIPVGSGMAAYLMLL
jgi:dolichol kinase